MKTNEKDETLEEINEIQSSTFQFSTPAHIEDFSDDPIKQEEMDTFWSLTLDGFTQQGMLNNPWNRKNSPTTTNYSNPTSNISHGEIISIKWPAFSGKLDYNFPNIAQEQRYEMADKGRINDLMHNATYSANEQQAASLPYESREWQDECCEWSVTRNPQNKITRVAFTSESPEYWHTLWQIDPKKVVALYQTVLEKPQITLEDLCLPGVYHPITNEPIYNPLNKWNKGTNSSPEQGGAIHLTNIANTLQAKIKLACNATIQRFNPTTDTDDGTLWSAEQYNDLICAGAFGEPNRHSDTNIGGTLNTVVATGNTVTLADPIGIYIQMPDFSNYVTPDGTDAATFWKIKRGTLHLNDQNGHQLPGHFILHAVFEVPEDKGYTVSDITIAGQKINWASQIAATFNMQIIASTTPASTPVGYTPVENTGPEDTFAQPLHLFYQEYFDKIYTSSISNPKNDSTTLLNNGGYVPLRINVGTTAAQMVVMVTTCTAKEKDPATYPKVTFDDPNISAIVTSVKENVNYGTSDNDQTNTFTALYLTVTVNSNTSIGQKGIYVTNIEQSLNVALPAVFWVSPVTIKADVAWQNTGVVITTNQTVKINYVSGQWTANPANDNGKLYGANGNPNFIAAKPGYTLPGQNEGALIGKVGGIIFLIGMGTKIPSTLAGEIQLCINDDLNGEYGAGLSDNVGAITVSIEVD